MGVMGYYLEWTMAVNWLKTTWIRLVLTGYYLEFTMGVNRLLPGIDNGG